MAVTSKELVGELCGVVVRRSALETDDRIMGRRRVPEFELVSSDGLPAACPIAGLNDKCEGIGPWLGGAETTLPVSGRCDLYRAGCRLEVNDPATVADARLGTP